MKHRIRAVHDDDLQGFLKSVGILGDLEAGRLICWFCSEPVTLDRLGAVVPTSGAIKVVCDQPPCLKSLDGGTSEA